MVDDRSFYLCSFNNKNKKGKSWTNFKKKPNKQRNCCEHRFIIEHHGETLKNEAINNKALDWVDDCLVSDPSLTSFLQPPETTETHPHGPQGLLLFRTGNSNITVGTYARIKKKERSWPSLGKNAGRESQQQENKMLTAGGMRQDRWRSILPFRSMK